MTLDRQMLRLFAVALTSIVISISAWAATTELVSISSTGAQGNGWSETPAVSADGRFVAFRSSATNLVAGDSNNLPDIFVRDRTAGLTERISINTNGMEGNGDCSVPSISADGRYVAFVGYSSNLVTNDTNNKADVFVHDRFTHRTSRVSISSKGKEGNDDSDGAGVSISSSGRYIIFRSAASNLVPNDTNGFYDTFVHDMQTGTTERISVSSTGIQGNGISSTGGISSNGRYATFWSAASNLVKGDTNGTYDVFLRDRVKKITTRISVSSEGQQGNNSSAGGWITGDAKYVIFNSNATNLAKGDSNGTAADVFVRHLESGHTVKVSVTSSGNSSNGQSILPWDGTRSLTRNGQYAVFASEASNLVKGDTNNEFDAFIRDRISKTTSRVSISSDGVEGNAVSVTPVLSDDGKHIAFRSRASNLVPGDVNDTDDIFIRTP